MNKNEFTKEVVKALNEMGVEVELTEVARQNVGTYTGLRPAGDGKIKPTVYIDEFYEKDLSVAETAARVAQIFVENENFALDIPQIYDFSQIKDRILPRLVMTEGNEEYLSDAVKSEWNDLSVIYTITLEMPEGSGSVVIRNGLFEKWNVTEDDLIEAATSNASDKAVIKTMGDIIINSFNHPVPECEKEQMVKDTTMLVVSYGSGVHGAGAIVSDEVVKKLHEIQGDFYILPSSVHELISIAADKVPVEDDLVFMVREVNNTEVSVEDRLSYSVYKYDSETEKIVLL